MFELWCQQDPTVVFWNCGWLPPPLSGPIPLLGFQACPFRTALLHSLSSQLVNVTLEGAAAPQASSSPPQLLLLAAKSSAGANSSAAASKDPSSAYRADWRRQAHAGPPALQPRPAALQEGACHPGCDLRWQALQPGFTQAGSKRRLGPPTAQHSTPACCLLQGGTVAGFSFLLSVAAKDPLGLLAKCLPERYI